MSREELIKAIEQNGSAASVFLGEVLRHSISSAAQTGDIIGELSSLDTDHKSNIVEAINEIFGVVGSQTLVISLNHTSAQIKAIYNECAAHLPLAKNIVFLNTEDNLYYTVNGYKFEDGVLYLHTIMQGEDGLRDMVVQVASNGSISVA